MARERGGNVIAPVGVLIEGWLGVTSTLLPLAQNQRMHAYIGKTAYQRPSSTRSRLKSLTFAFQSRRSEEGGPVRIVNFKLIRSWKRRKERTYLRARSMLLSR